MFFHRAGALLVSLLLLGGAPAEAVPEVREGDIVFQTSLSAQSQAIQLATHSRLSHVGIVARKDGRAFVYEAIGPVTFTPLEEWIARGEGKRILVKRLKTALTPEALAKLATTAGRFRGKGYDFAFEWSDDRIYCSELVYKTYKEALGLELGKLQRLGDFDLADPRVQKKLRERYGDKIPLDEPVISPAQIADSPLLVTALER
jgi:hypothetical protein